MLEKLVDNYFLNEENLIQTVVIELHVSKFKGTFYIEYNSPQIFTLHWWKIHFIINLISFQDIFYQVSHF